MLQLAWNSQRQSPVLQSSLTTSQAAEKSFKVSTWPLQQGFRRVLLSSLHQLLLGTPARLCVCACETNLCKTERVSAQTENKCEKRKMNRNVLRRLMRRKQNRNVFLTLMLFKKVIFNSRLDQKETESRVGFNQLVTLR